MATIQVLAVEKPLLGVEQVDTEQWRATIKACGQLYDLGTYATEMDAGLAYDCAARAMFEQPRLNFPGVEAAPRNRIIVRRQKTRPIIATQENRS